MEQLNQSDPKYIAAMALYMNGNWKAAEAAFQDLVAQYPNSAALFVDLGNTYYSLGKLNTAIQMYEKAIALNPQFGLAFYKLGVCNFRAGRLMKALEAFTTVVELKSQSHAMAQYFVALINFFLGRDDVSVEGFSALRTVSEESMIANFFLAQLHLKRNEFQKAHDLLAELLRETPGFAEVHYMMGMAEYGLHNNSAAVRCFQKVLELNPDDQRAKTKLALLTDVQWP